MPGTRSLESLLDKTKATLGGREEGQKVSAKDPSKVQNRFSAKALAQSSVQASLTFDPYSVRATELRVDERKRHRPFNCWFTRSRKTPDNKSRERKSTVDSSGVETGGKGAVACGMSLEDRLSRVNSMKGKTYSLQTGFALAQSDSFEIMNLVRCSVVPRGMRSGVDEDVTQTSQLLVSQAKMLSSSCSGMAVEYGSPEELLLTLTHSFHTLCCLAQACMSLLEVLDAESERRQAVAMVDEVVLNYVSLLKAAEEAAVTSPSDQSVSALMHHSATTSTILNSLTHFVTAMLSK